MLRLRGCSFFGCRRARAWMAWPECIHCLGLDRHLVQSASGELKRCGDALQASCMPVTFLLCHVLPCVHFAILALRQLKVIMSVATRATRMLAQFSHWQMTIAERPKAYQDQQSTALLELRRRKRRSSLASPPSAELLRLGLGPSPCGSHQATAAAGNRTS